MYQGFPGSYLLNMPNAGLQRETKMDYNIGADISVKNKLNLRFDYYQSFTENLRCRSFTSFFNRFQFCGGEPR